MRTNLWLLGGALAGYLLLMWTNPVRHSLRDGWRAVRRYPALWVTLGLCGFGYALFYLGARLLLAWRLPPEMEPEFIFARAPFRWDWAWVAGQETSLWYLPIESWREVARAALFPTLDSIAGLFNNLVSTFPLAAIAGLLLWVNWQGHQGVLLRALRKRFGWLGWLFHLLVLLAALAAMAKPILAFIVLPLPRAVWEQWEPVFAWVSFLFEYMVGVGIQIYLILLAYCWVRGIGFTHQHLVDVAIRRFSYVVRWAAVVMLLSTVFIDGPLIARQFQPFSHLLPTSDVEFERRLTLMRHLLSAALLVFATVQITLTFHSQTLGRGLLDHFTYLRRHGWSLLWLIIVAAIHFYALHLLDLVIPKGIGTETALGVAWSLIFPWLLALLGAWLLASWVSIFRQASGVRYVEREPVQLRLPLQERPTTASGG